MWSRATGAWRPSGLPSTVWPTPSASSDTARDILRLLGYPERTCELAAIAGYLHDIGNTVNRVDHAHSGAIMAFTLLNKRNMPPEEIGLICSAIGHHDEKTAFPVNPLAAALILSDKSDVRRSRVRKDAVLANDIHDRVNFAVVDTKLEIQPENKACIFHITIDTQICPVMEYFEIFLDRMILCRKAARPWACSSSSLSTTPGCCNFAALPLQKAAFPKERQLFCACKMRRKPPLAWAGGGFSLSYEW